MFTRQGNTYKINNVDSFVHCLHQTRSAISKEKSQKHIYYHYHEYIELLFS